MGLPDSMAASVKAARLAHAELPAYAIMKADFEEVESDIILERISSTEAERDQLRAKLDEIQALMLLRAVDAATSQARTMELKEALSQWSARLKRSDVTIENEQALVSKVHALEGQACFALHDEDAALEALTGLRKENDLLLEKLATLVLQAQTNEPELKELRHMRERTKMLETELAVQSRGEHGTRDPLAQAHRRAAEWEQRANENEAELEEARKQEGHAVRLEENHSPARIQLDEEDAEERLAKDCESKLRDHVAVLQARVVQFKTRGAATRPKKMPMATASVSSPQRPDLRASTAYPSRAATLTAPAAAASVNGGCMDDSIHAPLSRKAIAAAAPRRSVFASSRYNLSAAARACGA
ncbi:hypothetical protein EDB87DRAFT_1690034 [Lactarius vividus]|nr:hypothetical protein EDB87DRAFT_1690034 [Lactarius vividus]